MKTLLFLTVAFSAMTASANTFVCETGPEATPSDVYLINFGGEENTTVQYQRYPFYGAEVMSLIFDVPGCAPAQRASLSASELYVECDGDGDSGYLSLKLDGDKIEGRISFPEGNIGYSEDTELSVSCRRRE